MHDVAELLKGKILVGHALKNDLSVLMLEHHRSMIRDTACYPVYMSVSKWHSRYRHVTIGAAQHISYIEYRQHKPSFIHIVWSTS